MNGYTAQATAAASMYRKEQLLNLTPVEVIHKLFDVVILGCKKKDFPLAQRALNELVAGLDFEAGDLAVKLYNLYEYCKRRIRQDDPAEVINIIQDLKSTWANAFQISSDKGTTWTQSAARR
jgi:flagellin-specific chaperone FliS